MTKTMDGQIIFLKNKTIPIDKYECLSRNYHFDKIKFIPLIKHSNHSNEILKLFQDNKYLHTLKHIIVTSQRTVECLYLEVLPNLTLKERELLFNKRVYTVGPATGEFLRHCGFRDVIGDDTGNGANLSDMIIDTLPLEEAGEILFLVGMIRTDIIKNKLIDAGYQVNEIIAYETEPLKGNLQKLQHEIDTNIENWVVVFSPQGIDGIIEYLKEHKSLSIKIASIGPTTETFLWKNGIRPHVSSPKPTPESLLQVISSYQ
ncbi:uroporphyrinogen-III synthase [Monosporozyma servazzii]